MNNEFHPLLFGDKQKEKIQKESYTKWVESDYKGVIVLPTATGKSQIGLMALIKHRHLTKLFIVVPKVDLLNQWYDDIVKMCQVDRQNVGRIGGKYKEVGKPITIAVINSIRDKVFSSELLVLDEFHGMLSPKNIKFLQKGFHRKILGLTATIEMQNVLPVVYKMEQHEAVDKGLISKFKVVNIGCNLSNEEQTKYNSHTNIIKTYLPRFNFDLKEALIAIKCSPDQDIKQNALAIMRAIQHRKSLIGNSTTKLDTTIELIKNNINNKILVFCEYIKTADYIIRELKKDKIKAGKFHSKMTTMEKDKLFNEFKENIIRTMIAVKSLDEGTNIPDCDIAIIVSGSSVQRQVVQRIGRVVRVSEGKDYATIYQIYCKGTKDEDWTRKRCSYIKKAAIGVEWR